VRNPRVLDDPAPTVLVRLFADHGIDLELGAWIGDPDRGRNNLRSDLYRELWRAFREHGVRIPYPQREIRMLGPEGAGGPPDGLAEAEKGAASP
jgi:small-conductance mechanosensitive channel